MDKVVFTILTSDNIDNTIQISDTLFGTGYYTQENLNFLNKNAIIRIVQIHGRTVGFFIFRFLSKSTVSYLQSRSNELILEVKTIGITPENQRKGISRKILSFADEMALQNGIQESYSVAWENKGEVSAHTLHVNAGYKVIKKIENYWKLESVEQGYTCPTCGNPCLCSAVIYLKTY